MAPPWGGCTRSLWDCARPDRRLGGGGGGKWRWSTGAALALSSYVLVILLLLAALEVAEFSSRRDAGAWAPVVKECLRGSLAIVAAAVSWGYIHVGWRAKRSYQLHLHGLALLVINAVILISLASELLSRQHMCGEGALLLGLNIVLWAIVKGVIFTMIREKMMALGSLTVCHVTASQWGQALVLSSALSGFAGATLYFFAAGLIFAGLTCEEFVVISSLETFTTDISLASKLIIFLLLGMSGASAGGIFVASNGTLYAANRLRRAAVTKLGERQVDEELLAEVRRTLSHHILGMLFSITSAQLAIGLLALDSLNLLGDESQEDFIYLCGASMDPLGDIAGILLLSGLGVLFFHEDPKAGDISGHIRSILHSAVLTSRAEMVFEGHVDSAVQSGLCVASFPGKFLADWNGLTWACEQGDMCSACVFLPQADPLLRFGKHAPAPETPDRCWCYSIYGEEKTWGCLWWQAWLDNIERAVALDLELVAVFFPGEAGRGIVQWTHLRDSNLWDGVGLGGSQKAEVAYLKMRGFHVTELDIEAFRHRVGGMSSRRILAAN